MELLQRVPQTKDAETLAARGKRDVQLTSIGERTLLRPDQEKPLALPYEHREAQNSFDHKKRLTWTGVMIVGRVSFFLDLCVESAGGPCTPPDTDKRIPPCGIPIDSLGIFGSSVIYINRRFCKHPQIYQSRKDRRR